MNGLGNCVLVVEDEALIAMGFVAQVEDMGLAVCAVADTADQAVREAQTHRPGVVLMDVRLRGQGDGVDAAMHIHETVGSKVVFITGSREPATIDRINQDHPFAVMFKPVLDRQLRTVIQDAMRAALA
jgi:CheY-like chemotaxis protein